ncbi:MAG TPA: hypothetical protein VE990_14430 [Acidimicrobiales bacterium]|nr:hypothetical protein [Acidimicrobiales bacterium]
MRCRQVGEEPDFGDEMAKATLGPRRFHPVSEEAAGDTARRPEPAR